jgi:AcrR family transcriptional regulator
MARVVKQREVRRSELLDSAQKLFLKQGYERTTINDVIEDAGVSKGGFYHHFKAKEDLLEALTARLAQESIERFSDVLGTPGLDGLARLNAFFARGRKIKAKDASSLAATFHPLLNSENTLLYHRVHAAMVSVVAPVLARIIEQGKKERIFKVGDPLAAAEIILQISSANSSAMAALTRASGKAAVRAARAALEERLRFQGIAVDRILGLRDGSIALVDARALRPVQI